MSQKKKINKKNRAYSSTLRLGCLAWWLLSKSLQKAPQPEAPKTPCFLKHKTSTGTDLWSLALAASGLFGGEAAAGFHRFFRFFIGFPSVFPGFFSISYQDPQRNVWEWFNKKPQHSFGCPGIFTGFMVFHLFLFSHLVNLASSLFENCLSMFYWFSYWLFHPFTFFLILPCFSHNIFVVRHLDS